MGRSSILGPLFAFGLALAACSTTNADDPAATDCAADGSGCVTQGPTCTDQKRNGGEIGIDCGGSCPKKCDGAKGCTSNDQCASGDCKPDGTCGPTPGKTCGIGLPNGCADGDACSQDGDCTSDFCGDDQKCAEPPPSTHSDGRRNGGETGIDCGGTVASTLPCPAGQGCKTSDDCISTCNASGTCDAPGPTDGKKNNGETDVDCGGESAPKCALTKACLVNADCQLDACTAKKCVVPTSSDNTKNGGETDVDCGGAGVTDGTVTYNAPRCVIDKSCALGTDCSSTACTPGGKCALPSCATAETAGIVTCGKGETGDAAAVHESCCRSLVLPTRTTRRLDKYEITSGRFRSFLTNAGPNIRAWVATYIAANPTSQLAQMIASFPSLASIYPAADRFDNLSLTAHMSLDIDNYDGIRGCANYNGSYSANTYWMDAAHYADFGLPARSLPRSVSDEKPLNCAMPIMFAAFCAWDGGEMAKYDDYLDVWTQAFPWGPTDLNRPNYNWCNGTYQNGGFTCQCDGVHNACNFSTNGEVGVFYEFPIATDRSKDNSPLIAAPGRFQTDASALKSGGESWYDLFANLAEYTADFAPNSGELSTFCDLSAAPVPGQPTCTRVDPGPPASTKGPGTLHTGIPMVGMIGQTWEGHQYGKTSKASSLGATFQYGKFGARCVRPATPF